MKKYDVFELYVISFDHGKNYFICKYDELLGSYIEVFTHQIIDRGNVTFIEPLIDYYPMVDVMDYKKGRNLKLTKKDLLKDYIKVNSYNPNERKKKCLKISEDASYKSALDFYLLANKLKYQIRSGWDNKQWNINSDRLESVAEHVYGTCILAISMNSEFNFGIDINRVLKMLTVHEIGEIIIGDITPFDSITREQKLNLEHKAMSDVLGNLNDKNELLSLLFEFDEGKTKDAKFAYWCDKLEANIQCKIYQDKGMQRSFDEQENNLVFSNSKIKEMIEEGYKTPFDIWYNNDLDKFKDSKEFTRVLKYIKDNNLNK